MTNKQPTFEVDKDGLAKLLERRGKEFAVTELVQNAWDENTKTVTITLLPEGNDKARLTVIDDNPEGFSQLSHAYTLFAESEKKSDANKRGRFNLGEKLVIAVCEEAKIVTTKGTVTFADGHRTHSDSGTEAGSEFSGLLPMSEDEVEMVAAVVHRLIPPAGIQTTYNDLVIPFREPVAVFEVKLRTEVADDEGRLKPTVRKTKVHVYEPIGDEPVSIYEMGIPVVETGDRWHISIDQKIPLNMDRDNVPPSYLRDVRAHVLNHCSDMLSEADSQAKWVDNAMEDDKVEEGAVKDVIKARFGDKTVIADPTDREAERIAASKGYTVIPGGALSKAAWKNVRDSGATAPAGQVTPSPNPNGVDSRPQTVMSPEHYTKSIAEMVEHSKEMGERLLGINVKVTVVNEPQWPFAATWARSTGELTYNLGRLGFKFFDSGIYNEQATALIIHEFAHNKEGSEHLSQTFYEECCRLGAKWVSLMRSDCADGKMQS